MDAAPAHSCRCCLRRAPDRDLTTPYTHLGTTEIYSDMFKECFEIHLTLDSEEKVGICDVCVGRLRDASDFKLQVQRSQEELHSWLQRAPHVKEENPAVESILEDGDGCGEEPVSFEESPVKIKSENEGGTNDEEGPDLSLEESPVKIKSENEGGTNDEEGPDLSHEAPAGEPEASGDEEEDCISLAWAGAECADLEPARPVSARARELDKLAMACSVRLERLRGDEAPRASQTCLATPRRGPRLASRMKDTPGDTAGLRAQEQAYICDTCGDRFRSKSGISKHVKKHAPKKTSRQKYVKGYKEICDVCNKQLASVSLEAHKRLHTGEKPFACGFCDKRFAQLSTLNAHTPQHTGERRFSCNICNQRFTRMYTLRKHQKIKHQESHKDEERPFKCEECDKKFKFMYYLQAHKRTHLKVKPYGCDICDKRFLRNWELTLHLEAHAGKSRFTCQVCNKQFSYRTDLRKHEVMHTKIKPYACDVCHKRFPYKNSLNRHSVRHHRAELNQHLRTHTAEQRYTCDICKNQFKLKRLLIRHIKSHM